MANIMARVVLTIILTVTSLSAGNVSAADPLPSWKEGPTKKAILSFVTRVTDRNGTDFISPEDRIATFDNDGTCWIEKPLYIPLFANLERF